MTKLHTHYDNLKVTRNAPPEVIRAAYKTLSQKYHPDKHPGNADAERVMALINASYQVLSDPAQRAQHDRWIDQQEGAAHARAQGFSASRAAPPPAAPVYSSQTRAHYQASPVTPPPNSVSRTGGRWFAHVVRHWFIYGVAGFLMWIWYDDQTVQPPAGPKLYQAITLKPQPEPVALTPKPLIATPRTPMPAAHVRPSTAPNGQPWPLGPGYVEGYARQHSNGLSTVTVDNSRNDSDVFVKLVSLDGAQAYPVRQFFIPAFGSFTLKNVTAGNYDVRYRDLDTGGISRSEAITLIEVHTSEGADFSNFTMTLYKVRNGNMQTYRLSEAEF